MPTNQMNNFSVPINGNGNDQFNMVNAQQNQGFNNNQQGQSVQHQQQLNNAISYVNSFFRTGTNAQATRAVNWGDSLENNELSKYTSQVLGGTQNNIDHVNMLKEQCLQQAVLVIQRIINDTRFPNNRADSFYGHFLESVKKSRNNNDTTFNPYKSNFIEKYVLNNQAVLLQIATNSSVVVGYLYYLALLEVTTKGVQINFNRALMEDLILKAVYNTTTMEFINWCTGTQEGRSVIYKGDRYVSKMLESLSNYLVYFEEAYAQFGMPSPYKDVKPYQPNSTANLDGNLAYRGVNNYTPDQLEMIKFAERQANLPTQYNQNRFENEIIPDDGNTYGCVEREDITLIEPSNRHKYNMLNWFTPIGDTGWYYIPEKNWLYIKRVWRPKDPSVRDATIPPGYERIVKIDFTKDDGYETTLIKASEKTMKLIFTDPSTLIPLIKESNDGKIFKVWDTDVKEITEKKDGVVIIKPAKIEEMKDNTLVTSDELLYSDNSQDIENAVNSFFNLSDNKDESFNFGVSLPVITYKSIRLQPGLAKKIKSALPMLNNLVNVKCSYIEFISEIEEILTSFKLGPGNTVYDEISARLTQAFNRWLCESRGYGPIKNSERYLSVTDILEDITSIAEYLARNDTGSFELIKLSGACPELIGASQFLATNVAMDGIKRKVRQNNGIVGQMMSNDYENDLVFIRQIIITKLRTTEHPYAISGFPIIVKNSYTPVVFHYNQANDERFKPITDGYVEQIFLFDDDRSLWTFTKSGIDNRFTATMRAIARSSQLVDLGFEN